MVEGKKQIEAKVIEVIAEKSCIDQEKIHLGSSLIDDLAMDSLDAVEATFQFEENYGLEIPDDDIRGFKTVQDIVDYIHDRVNGS
jgi:acyl carrier protein